MKKFLFVLSMVCAYAGAAYAETSLVYESADMGNVPEGLEWVDMGRGVLWANMNVGATAPEEYGEYFMWGDTIGYTSDINDGFSFCWTNYKWMTAGWSSCYGVNKYTFADGQTSGCWYNNGNFVGDNKTVLEAEDDAATAKWGCEWRIPTDQEWMQLGNPQFFTWTWTTLNGVNGFRVESEINGNSIFLPAAGNRSDRDLNKAGTHGSYWAADIYTAFNKSYLASGVDFNYSGPSGISVGRCVGRSVRPVRCACRMKRIEVNVEDGAAEFVWPTDSMASTYIIDVRMNGAIFCHLTLNQYGQLISISFAPGRAPQDIPELPSELSFVVNGLQPATLYSYTIAVVDANGTPLHVYQGQFATSGYPDEFEKGGYEITPTPPVIPYDPIATTLQTPNVVPNAHFILDRGQLLIQAPAGVFTILGQRIR